MDTITILNTLVTLFSVGGAILAWIAKIRWSDEYIKANEAIIKAKDAILVTKDEEIILLKAQITHYKDLSPEMIWKQVESSKKFYDEYIKTVETEKKAAEKAIKKMEEQINSMQKEGKESETKYQNLQKEHAELKKQFENLNKNLDEIKRQPGKFPVEAVFNTSGSSLAISNMLNRGTAQIISNTLIPFIGDGENLRRWEEIQVEKSTINKIDLD